MENKPNSVFEKLDNQAEKIEDISAKLEGISIEDLYALAKRTWDYEDYQTAQKYYNHISLLRPLDWEAPLYASLCNFMGSHEVNFWEYGLDQVTKVLVSTINYINGLSISHDEKNSEMSRCLEIIKDYMITSKKMYFKNKEIFNNYIPDFVSKLESYFLSIYNKTLAIELDPFTPFRVFISNECLDLIQVTNVISSDITKEEYQKLAENADKDFSIDYDAIMNSQIESSRTMSIEEKKEIMLKGKKIFEYKDKVITKRIFKRNLIFGMIFVVLSTIGLVISFLSKWYWLLTFIFSLAYGLLLVIKAFKEKNSIVCSSLLCSNRTKNRLTSDGNIVEERKFNFLFFITLLGMVITPLISLFMVIIALDKHYYLSGLFTILVAINVLFSYVSLRIPNAHFSKLNGTISYYYKGKYYKLD